MLTYFTDSRLMMKTVRPQTLFIIDAAGAALSAFMLGVVLMRLESVFGMPSSALTVLAALPVGFLVFDLFCLATKRAEHARFLLYIGLFNLAYCCVSVGYIFRHIRDLTTLGWLYFIVEVLLVLGLAVVELRAAAAAR